MQRFLQLDVLDDVMRLSCIILESIRSEFGRAFEIREEAWFSVRSPCSHEGIRLFFTAVYLLRFARLVFLLFHKQLEGSLRICRCMREAIGLIQNGDAWLRVHVTDRWREPFE
jgi:hypothetical protein